MFRAFSRVSITVSLALVLAGGWGGVAQAESRATTVVNAITAFNAKLSAGDRQEKYCSMAESPFRFYRGTNHLFWDDFAGDSRINQFSTTKTKIWLQGDLHTDNFGVFDNDDGKVVFNLNDFDETIIADYQYDLWRMATSIVLVARSHGGFSQSNQDAIVDAFTETYLDAMASYRSNDSEKTVEFTSSNAYGIIDELLTDVGASGSRTKLLDKWTKVTSGNRRFNLDLADLDAATSTETSGITAAMAAYGTTLTGGISYTSSHFKVKDVARRLHAGTGSLGTPRFYVLIDGASTSNSDDRILDIKLQGNPTAQTYLGSLGTNPYPTNNALRQSVAYRALLPNADDYLGWMRFYTPENANGYYSVREVSPYKESLDTTDLNSLTRFTKVAEQWGTILASAHARADKDFDATLIAHSIDKEIDDKTNTKHDEFRAVVRGIAFPYALQVEADWDAFVDSLAPGYCP